MNLINNRYNIMQKLGEGCMGTVFLVEDKLYDNRQVALKTIRKQDYVGRWGGEKFLLLFPETDLEGGQIITEKIRKRIADSVYEFNGLMMNVTMTFGICLYDKSLGIDECLKRADNALYRGKEAGRNQVVSANEK